MPVLSNGTALFFICRASLIPKFETKDNWATNRPSHSKRLRGDGTCFSRSNFKSTFGRGRLG
jgi:hypothetical protein